MPKYKSLWNPKGSIDNITFFTYRGEPYLKPKSNLTKERFRTEPEFEASRKASKVFGIAAQYATTIRKVATLALRKALGPHSGPDYDGTFHSTLSKVIAEKLRMDPVTPPSLHHLVGMDPVLFHPARTRDLYTDFSATRHHIQDRIVHINFGRPEVTSNHAGMLATHAQVFAFLAPLDISASRDILTFRTPWIDLGKTERTSCAFPLPPADPGQSTPLMLCIGARAAMRIGERYPDIPSLMYVEILDILDPADTFPPEHRSWQSPAFSSLLKKIDPSWTLVFPRDGSLNQTMLLPRFWEEFDWKKEALETMPLLAKTFGRICVLAWHPDVGDGEISQEELDEIHEQMTQAVQRAGGRIDAVEVCPHGKKEDCTCRLPRAGLFHQLQKRHPGIVPEKTIFMASTPLQAHMAAKHGVHVLMFQEGHAPFHTVKNLISGWVLNFAHLAELFDPARPRVYTKKSDWLTES